MPVVPLTDRARQIKDSSASSGRAGALTRELAKDIIKSVVSYTKVSKHKQVAMYKKKQCLKHYQKQENFTVEEATARWHAALRDGDVLKDVEDGKTVVGVKLATFWDFETGRCREHKQVTKERGQVNQVSAGEKGLEAFGAFGARVFGGIGGVRRERGRSRDPRVRDRDATPIASRRRRRAPSSSASPPPTIRRAPLRSSRRLSSPRSVGAMSSVGYETHLPSQTPIGPSGGRSGSPTNASERSGSRSTPEAGCQARAGSVAAARGWRSSSCYRWQEVHQIGRHREG